jgi:hypothetical protein
MNFIEAERAQTFWVGYSLVQVPKRILDYAGRSEALVLADLYKRACSAVSRTQYQLKKLDRIEISIGQEELAYVTGLSVDGVSLAVLQLEADLAVKVHRRHHDPRTGQTSLSVYLLRHSTTHDPLFAVEGGICYGNGDFPFITIPKDALPHMNQLPARARAVYLSALWLASERKEMSFGVLREQWKEASRLSKNSFNRGLHNCKRLLSYKRQTLTLFDPSTGAPSQRTAHEWVQHENTRWQFDIKRDVKLEDWKRIVADLFKQELNYDENGRSYTSRDIRCPFCHGEQCFQVNIQTGWYRCFNSACSRPCADLFFLVKRVLNARGKTAIAFIRARTATPVVA